MNELRSLDPDERRVVGALVEKQLSTPNLYPLTLNALLAACNQSSNRDPVRSLTAEQLQATLERLMGIPLVWRDRGARTVRWKHLLDEKLALDQPGKAILAELLLRGPQTPGELRARCERMHSFAGLGEVEAVLTELAARRVVSELPRQPGQKERRWRELLGEGVGGEAARLARRERQDEGPREAAEGERDGGVGRQLGAQGAAPSSPPAQPPGPGEGGLAGRAAAAPATPVGRPDKDLRQRVEDLERLVAELARRLGRVEAGRDEPER